MSFTNEPGVPSKLYEIEEELAQAGRFTPDVTERFDHFEGELRVYRYLCDQQHSNVTFTVWFFDNTLCQLETSLVVSSAMPEHLLRRFMASYEIGLLRRRHRVKATVFGSRVRTSFSVPVRDYSKGSTGVLLVKLFEALHTAHGVMRRAGVGQWILAPDPQEFWGESAQSAASRTEQLQTSIKRFCVNQVAIQYTDELAGGGQLFEAEAMQFIKDRIDAVPSAYEWCAGPGFLGFSLLARELCQSLCLSDLNPMSVSICRETVTENDLGTAVSIYESDCLDQIPSSEQWDLVIGNPPWRKDAVLMPRWGRTIKYQDFGLRLHKRFFESISGHLKKGAHILLIESYITTEPGDFHNMIATAGLTLISVWNHSDFPMVYFLWITNQGN